MSFAALQKHSPRKIYLKYRCLIWNFQPRREFNLAEIAANFLEYFFSGVGLGQDVCRVFFKTRKARRAF